MKQGKLKRKLNEMYNDMDDKKLQIVEDDECSNGKIKADEATLDAKSSTNPVLKIGSKSALKFRALIKYECVQSFIHEADFVFYQYIVDYLIPKVCSYWGFACNRIYSKLTEYSTICLSHSGS